MASTSFPRRSEQDNYKSATNANDNLAVQRTIRSEIAEGNYVITNSKPIIGSALGAISKPDSKEMSLIHDCCRPLREGLNDYVQTQSFKFQTLDDALKMLGPQ